MKKIIISVYIFVLAGCSSEESASVNQASVSGTWAFQENECLQSGISYSGHGGTITFSGSTGTEVTSDSDCSITDTFDWSGDINNITISNRTRSCSVESCIYNYTDEDSNPQTVTCVSGDASSDADSGGPVPLNANIDMYFERVFTVSSYSINLTFRDKNQAGSPVVGNCSILYSN